MAKSAIVTMVVGDRYRTLWERYCAPNWTAYASQHGFDIRLIDHPLDASELARRRGLNWQKLLIGAIPELGSYEHLVWVDADIVINARDAPSILEGMPSDRIGAVRYHALLRHPLFAAAHRRICGGYSPDAFCAGIFENHGLAGDPTQMIQTGVLAIPRGLAGILESIYEKYPVAGAEQYREQAYVSHELSAAGLIHFLDEKFNAVWYEYKYGLYFGDARPEENRELVRRVLAEVYFLHFAGNLADIELVSD